MNADPLQKTLRVRSGELVIGLHGRSSHPLDCQLRSEIHLSTDVNPPKRGDRDDIAEAKRPGSGFQSCHHRKHRNEAGEHASSFIGEMHPSVVWSQSATYFVVSAKLQLEQHANKASVQIMWLHLSQYQCCRSVAFKKQVRTRYRLQNCSGQYRMSSFLKDPQCIAARTRNIVKS